MNKILLVFALLISCVFVMPSFAQRGGNHGGGHVAVFHSPVVTRPYGERGIGFRSPIVIRSYRYYTPEYGWYSPYYFGYGGTFWPTNEYIQPQSVCKKETLKDVNRKKYDILVCRQPDGKFVVVADSEHDPVK
jgi:hypothetical protein